MKKILSMIVIVMILFNSLNVNASSQNYYFTYVIGENNSGYWINDDPAMPDSGSYFFYVKNGLVYYLPESDAIPLILNKAIGLTLNPTWLVTFYQNYILNRVVTSPMSRVNNGTSNVGITFDDLENLPVQGTSINIPQDEEIQLPSSYVNNVYNYYSEWVEDNDLDLPDYVNIETRPVSFYENKLNTSATNYEAFLNFLHDKNENQIFMSYSSLNLTYSPQQYFINKSPNDLLFVANYTSGASNTYQQFCQLHNLSFSENVVNFVDMMLQGNGLNVDTKYLDNGTLQNQDITKVVFSSNGTYSESNSGALTLTMFSSERLPGCPINYITVYKNMTVLNQIVQETYAPTIFYSEDYYSFSTSNDNTITTTISEVDNSSETNSTIYNTTSESFTEYYTENNYHIDNSVVITNNTEIFNTYYGDASGRGDDNGGDNDGGGEIIVPDYDFGYLKVITDILAEFLQGVQNLNEMIIETIHSITLSFGGITTLFESVFGWLPDPILGLMIIGLGLALLGSFITWFR